MLRWVGWDCSERWGDCSIIVALVKGFRRLARLECLHGAGLAILPIG